MKTIHALALGALLLAVLSPATHAAGPLMPPGAPGAPAAEMPSLAEVQSAARGNRTLVPARTTTLEIDSPGSYVLTGNITVSGGNGVLIKADCVTIDLNGFCIESTNGARTGAGITVEGAHEDITIRNGHITGSVTYDPQNTGAPWAGAGFQDGINLVVDGSNWADNITIDTITVSNVGRHGIYCGQSVTVSQNAPPVIAVAVSSVVRDCTVRLCGGAGIVGTTVTQCVARQSYAQGIVCHSGSNCSASSYASDGVVGYTLINCYGTSDGAGRGVAGHQSQNCNGSSVSGFGVEAYNAQNCQGTSQTSHGMHATSASGCTGTSSGGSGGANAASIGLWAQFTVTGSTGVGKQGIFVTEGMVSTSTGKTYGNAPVGNEAITAPKAIGCLLIKGNANIAAGNTDNTLVP